MSVELLDIAFNHGASGSQALTVRRNLHQAVAVPEWRGQSGAEAVVCYPLDRLANGPISIRVHVGRHPPEVDRIEVRAIAHAAPQLPVFWWPSSIGPALSWPAGQSLAYWAALYATLGSMEQVGGPAPTPFGDVASQELTFQPNDEAIGTFTVVNTSLAAHGVGVRPVRWRWQLRRSPGAAWTDFAFTRHTVYTVLRAPTQPWLQLPDDERNTQLPWTELLDVACRWAAGATTVEAAAARVTEAVYQLGRTGVLDYDCAGPSVFSVGTPHYTLLPGFFDCSAFLERIHGGFGNGRFVNCSDCAAAVSTFANVLGCDLWQSRMFGPVPFPLNPTRSIGSRLWLSACSVGAYSMHEVAWTGACGIADHVYDACVEVDGDVDPTRPPHTPHLPVNLRFGAPGQGQYRDRLAAPSGRIICQPQPLTRQRRLVM
jgi:hypothetical protein